MNNKAWNCGGENELCIPFYLRQINWDESILKQFKQTDLETKDFVKLPIVLVATIQGFITIGYKKFLQDNQYINLYNGMQQREIVC